MRSGGRLKSKASTRMTHGARSAQARLDDLVGIADRLAALDLVDVLHARDDLAPDRVFPVEEGRVGEADEELRIGRIRARGARHRHRPALVRLGVELGLEIGIFRPAGSRSVGAAGLGHEPVDHPVKDDPVVKALGDQPLDVRDMARRQPCVHFDHHRALARLEGQRIAFAAHFVVPYCFAAGAMRMVTILSGFSTAPLLASVPALILSTASIPETTSPKAVSLPSRKPPSPNMMKNCEWAEFGSSVRAMPKMPRLKWVWLNSAGRLGSLEPPPPVPVGSPVWAMKPGMTRWKVSPS